MASIFLRVSRMWKTATLGACIAITQEMLLASTGIALWILSPDTPRSDFVAANREGIFSLAGYVAIYLVGVALGELICQRPRYDQELNTKLTLKISKVIML